MFKNCRIHGAVIVEDIVEMRSEDFHVLGGIGRLVPVRESHCHVHHLVVVRRFAFSKGDGCALMLGVGQTACHGSSGRCLHTMLPWHGTLRGRCGGYVA